MKIDGTHTGIQIDAYMRQAQQQQQEVQTQEQAAQQTAKADKVQISQAALETQKAAEFLKESPDVREDKVRDIKLEVESGRYHRPAEQVANNMLNEGFENDLILKKIDTRA
jgi:negative regulator of flagellin synthesis FlgM